MKKKRINIAEIHPSTDNLGPGKRFAIWVQGCPFKCKNCIAPDWIPFEVNKPMLLTRLVSKIIAAKDIEGITISGGEPFMQASQLALILQKVRLHLSLIHI